jgi:hypothetical protein
MVDSRIFNTAISVAIFGTKLSDATDENIDLLLGLVAASKPNLPIDENLNPALKKLVSNIIGSNKNTHIGVNFIFVYSYVRGVLSDPDLAAKYKSDPLEVINAMETTSIIFEVKKDGRYVIKK